MSTKGKQSKEAKAPDPAARIAQLEAQLKDAERLQAQARLSDERAAHATSAAAELEAAAAAAREQLRCTRSDFADVAQHHRREAREGAAALLAAEAQAAALAEALRAREEEVAALQRGVDAAQHALDAASAELRTKGNLERALAAAGEERRAQGHELRRLRGETAGLAAALAGAGRRVEELELKSAVSHRVAIVFGDAWLLHGHWRKLRGPAPAPVTGASLHCVGGKLVLFGGQPLRLGGGRHRSDAPGNNGRVLQLPQLLEPPAAAAQARDPISETDACFRGNDGDGSGSGSNQERPQQEHQDEAERALLAEAHCVDLGPSLRWHPATTSGLGGGGGSGAGSVGVHASTSDAGNTSSDSSSAGRDMHRQHHQQQVPPVVWGHAAVAIGPSKLLVDGGRPRDAPPHPQQPHRRAPLCQQQQQQQQQAEPAVRVLSTETLRVSATPLASTSDMPPRWGHAIAALGDAIYVFGGQAVSAGSARGRLLGDLWRFDADRMAWALVSDGKQDPGAPCPRRGASLVADAAERALLLLGGWDGTGTLGDVHRFNADTGRWCAVKPTGTLPLSRERAAATLAPGGRYLLLHGGVHTRPNSQRQLHDLMVLDTRLNRWAVLDDGAAAAAYKPPPPPATSTAHAASAANGLPSPSSLPSPATTVHSEDAAQPSPSTSASATGQHQQLQQQQQQPGTVHSAFLGQQLYVLRPGRHGTYDELRVVTITTADDVAALRHHATLKPEVRNDRLVILAGEAERSQHSLALAWRPATRGSERVTSYRLFVAASGSAAVRLAYEGPATHCKVSGLRPGVEHVLCVRASYVDGSVAWSDSVALSTLSHKATTASAGSAPSRAQGSAAGAEDSNSGGGAAGGAAGAGCGGLQPSSPAPAFGASPRSRRSGSAPALAPRALRPCASWVDSLRNTGGGGIGAGGTSSGGGRRPGSAGFQAASTTPRQRAQQLLNWSQTLQHK